MAVSQERQPRRWTRDEYYRMAETGIFKPDERVELLEGEIIRVPPQNYRHAGTVTKINRLLIQHFAEPWEVRCQVPLDISKDSQPEPDFAVVAPRDDRNRAHPVTAALIIEIADTSLRYDRVRKGRVYARAGIPEYWIVNLQENQLEVLRKPAKSGVYKEHLVFGPGQSVTCLAQPERALPIEALLLSSPTVAEGAGPA